MVRPADVNVASGDESDDSDQPAHQREDQPRGRPVRWRGCRAGGGRQRSRGDSAGYACEWRGRCVASAGALQGRSILQLRLTYLTLNGHAVSVGHEDLTQTKKGKGKRSAAFIGGGAGLGMLIGGVATGGAGLLVGGLVGAGGGTALGGLTGNRDIEIPAESIVRFRLANNLVFSRLGCAVVGEKKPILADGLFLPAGGVVCVFR